MESDPDVAEAPLEGGAQLLGLGPATLFALLHGQDHVQLLGGMAPWTPAALLGLWLTAAAARARRASVERFLWCWAILRDGSVWDESRGLVPAVT